MHYTRVSIIDLEPGVDAAVEETTEIFVKLVVGLRCIKRAESIPSMPETFNSALTKPQSLVHIVHSFALSLSCFDCLIMQCKKFSVITLIELEENLLL